MEKKTTNAPKAAKKEEKKPVDLLDVLLDKDNRDPIVLQDEKGRQITFEQVAIIPYDIDEKTRKLYVVLKPVDKVEGIADDEAVVFVCDQDKNGNTVLKVEENEELAISVFDKYYDLLEEASAKAKKTAKPAAKKTATKAAAKATGKTAGKTAGKKTTK